MLDSQRLVRCTKYIRFGISSVMYIETCESKMKKKNYFKFHSLCSRCYKIITSTQEINSIKLSTCILFSVYGFSWTDIVFVFSISFKIWKEKSQKSKGNLQLKAEKWNNKNECSSRHRIWMKRRTTHHCMKHCMVHIYELGIYNFTFYYCTLVGLLVNYFTQNNIH